MGLTQIDLRHEVIDHMSLNIEKQLGNGLQFQEAFEIEMRKWAPELRSSFSLWLGIANVGPKIMIDKCARITKELYLKSGIAALLTTLIFYFLRPFWNNDTGIFIIKDGLGVLLLAGVLFLVYGFYQNYRLGLKSSYSFLFKLSSSGYFLFTVIMNPFAMATLYGTEHEAFNFTGLFFSLFALSFGYFTYELFQKHKLQAKRYANG
ncbi:MAG: hypothetical protein HKP53_02200 [Eudoraea sp.]|nr:hypothetical protein [Eudoraea sp.]